MKATIVRAPNGARYLAAAEPSGQNNPTQPTGGWFPIPPIFKTEGKVEAEEPTGGESEATTKKNSWLILLVAGVVTLVMVLILRKK